MRWLTRTLVVFVALIAVAWSMAWKPLPGVELGAVPALAAPLRTPAEHDAISDAREEWPITCELEGAGGAVIVIGIRHTQDPEDPQIRALGRFFQAFRPTQVLVEGRLGWWIGGTASVIERFGESGAAAVLAKQSGAPCHSLEPDFAEEVRDAVDGFGEQRTLAFYFLRVFVSERDAGVLGDDIEAEAGALLRKRGRLTGLGEALPDLGAMDRFWNASYPPHPDWRSLPREALWRTRSGSWTQEIAERINAFRDRHMVAAIADGARRGERVLAVCGSSHLILFEPALRAAVARKN